MHTPEEHRQPPAEPTDDEIVRYLLGDIPRVRALQIRSLMHADPELKAKIEVLGMMSGDRSDECLMTRGERQLVDKTDKGSAQLAAIAGSILHLNDEQRGKLKNLLVSIDQLAKGLNIVTDDE